ncbi:hypothetical protein TCELL_0231 [Thermogladius calderae 1633]|uniref:Uncharacterized protein n=1 Tax=Thermogladius calderae (strain DSM 22663 / VKM B-2946 / 1633) TaxID=1184251 RepID=I3TD18_THEC1|nr:A24 family peptidase C-terminal domain-containing protein [Thermogladius calderae]AFK50656.1 hypothetical protein TCELL_0231 [Thermogladius calderae 1633]
MIEPSLLAVVEYAITLLFLAPFSVYDYKKRDIPDKLVYLFLAVSAVFCFLNFYLVKDLIPFQAQALYTLVSVVPVPLVLLILTKLELVGLADFYVVTSIAIAYSAPLNYPTLLGGYSVPVPPIVYSVLIYALVLQIAVHYGVLVVRLHGLGFRVPKGFSAWDKVFLVVAGWPLTVSELLEKDYYVPLQEPFETPLGVEWRLKGLTKVEDSELRSRIGEFLERGLVKHDEVVWASYGHPLVVYILFGFIIFLVRGF